MQTGGHQHHRTTLAHQGQRLLRGEIHPAGVDGEGLVEMFRRDVLGQDAFDIAGTGDDNIEPAFFGSDRLIKPVEIAEIGDVALDGRDIAADRGFGLVELALAASHDEHIGALFHEFLRGRQSDSARSAGDDGDFSAKLGHDTDLSFLARTKPFGERHADVHFR
jgi:hypothetical protein